MLKNINGLNMYKLLKEKRADNKDALNFIDLVSKTNDCVFLTGKAGTGKSTLIKDIIDLAKNVDEYPLVLGSTGISALNVGGQTVHSFFSLGIEHVKFQDIQHYIKDKKNRKYKLKKDKRKILEKVPFVVIDEISMLSSNIIDCVNFMMKYYLAKQTGNDELISKPFGGKQVIFVGDVFQLPPVKNREWEEKVGESYDSEWFFDSTTFKKLNYWGIELKKSYRQANDQDFAEILDAIRYEIFDEEHIEKLNKQKTENLDKEIVLLSTHRNKVSNINDIRLSELEGKEEMFYASEDGLFPNSMKKVEESLRLKIGAKVMLVTNDVEKRWVNGSVGIIKDIGIDDYEDQQYLEIDINRENIYVKKHRRDNKIVTISNGGRLEEEILGTYTQFPVQLAYAMTIHKSQGLTFDNCQIDLSNTFTGGQAYTALSRSRTLNGLKIFGEVKKEQIFFDERIKIFIKNSFQEKVYNIDSNIDFFVEDNDHQDFEKEIISINESEKKEKEVDDIVLSDEDLNLFEKLKKVRLDFAKEEDVPAYFVFSNKVLKRIALYKPQSKKNMLKIKGIKEKKFEKYGQIFIDKIKELGYKSCDHKESTGNETNI